MASTREKILAHALRRFNADGIEAVAIRELARELGISPGNLSYHFARKDDLVMALVHQLREDNDRQLEQSASNLREFMERYEGMFRNQWRYRCLLLGIVHLFEHNEHLAGDYAIHERRRRASLADQILALQGEGGLREQLEDAQRALLLAQLTMLGRFWIVEKRISFPRASLARALDHYLAIIAQTILPWSNAQGADMLAPYLERPLLDSSSGA